MPLCLRALLATGHSMNLLVMSMDSSLDVTLICIGQKALTFQPTEISITTSIQAHHQKMHEMPGG